MIIPVSASADLNVPVRLAVAAPVDRLYLPR